MLNPKIDILFEFPKSVSRIREFRDFFQVLTIIFSKAGTRTKYFLGYQKPEREHDENSFNGNFEKCRKMAGKLMCLIGTCSFR